MLHNSLIKLSHQNLMTAITNVGHQIKAKGICFGLANAGMMAILAGGLLDLLNTLVYISKLSETQQCCIGKYLRDSAENIEELNTNKWLSQQVWDVLALFDIILLTQHPDAYRHLFSKNMRQITSETLVYTAPAKLRQTFYYYTLTGQSILPEHPRFKIWQIQGLIRSETHVAIKEIGALPVAYRYDQLSELTNLLNEIKRYFYLPQNMPNVALILGSPSHAITISYDVKDKVWVFIEINKLKKTAAGQLEIAKEIHEAFADNPDSKEDIVFTIRIYSAPMTTQQTDQLHISFDHVLQYSDTYLTNNIIDIIKIRFIADKEQYSLLSLAAESNDVYVVDRLLQAGIDFPARNKALVIAAYYGHLESVDILLAGKAEVNFRSEIRCVFTASALVSAAAGGFLNVVKLLMNRGADINLGDVDFGLTPLYHAALNNHAELVSFLLKYNNIKIDFTINVNVAFLIEKIIYAHNIPEEKVEEILGNINGMEFINIKPLQLVRLMGYDNIVEIILSHQRKRVRLASSFVADLVQQIDKLIERQTGNRTLFQFIGGMDIQVRKEKRDALTEMRDGLIKAATLTDAIYIVRGGFCDARLQKHGDRLYCGMIYPDHDTQDFEAQFSNASTTIQQLIGFLEAKHHVLNMFGVQFKQSDYFPPLEKFIDKSASPICIAN